MARNGAEGSSVHEYEDVDKRYEERDGKDVFVLSSGLKRQVPRVPPTRHRDKDEDQKYKDEDKKYEDVDKKYKDEDKKYEDVDKKYEDVDKKYEDVPRVPPPRHHDKDEDKKYKDEDKKYEDVDKKYEDVDKKYEDVDKKYEDGKNCFALSSGLKRKEPEVPPRRDRKKESKDVDKKDVSNVSSSGLKREMSPPRVRHLDMGDHVVDYGGYKEETHPDDSYKPDDTYRGKDEKNCCSGLDAKGCVTEMWSKFKSRRVYALGCGLVVIVAVVNAVVLSTYLGSESKEHDSKPQGDMINGDKLKKPFFTPSFTEFYAENISTVVNSTLFSSPSMLALKEFVTTTSGDDDISPVTLTSASLSTTAIDECIRNPCQHGTCVSNGGAYDCTCSPGWTGQNCQQDINECTMKPCLHGRCENKDGGYNCTCSHGWTGRNCQDSAGPCHSGWTEYNNHCYRVIKEEVDWVTASRGVMHSHWVQALLLSETGARTSSLKILSLQLVSDMQLFITFLHCNYRCRCLQMRSQT
ncbi:uncharacterized protein LOC118430140 [Branchiostoma floridae]|uniref:Uncharacterized protein LOC118430140 n=1 Tax=Branchiostoma floridae TaxID=7739 RepID=A0A9J7M9K0_BRAFL|nr:uncharacterized protein LOC118430140 [Branchiostoma floridae]